MKKIATYIIAVLLCLPFTSCFDPLFSEMRKEVKPTDATILGRIISIARNTEGENEYLYIANGGIMRKNVTTVVPEADKWESFPKPPSVKRVQFLATDSSGVLYALCFNYTEDIDEGEYYVSSRKLFAYSDGSWNEVLDEDSPLLTLSGLGNRNVAVTLFGTNNPIKGNRHAFVNINGTIYELKGGAPTKIYNGSSYVGTGDYAYTAENNLKSISRSAIKFGGKVYFGSAASDNEYNTPNLMCTNEVAGSTARGTTEKAATCVYFVKNNNVLCCFQDDTGSKNPFASADRTSANYKEIGTGSNTFSISATQDCIFIGTKEGLRKISLENGMISGSSTDNFPTNAGSSLSKYYHVSMIYVVDSSKNELGCEAYASIDFDGSSASTSAQFKRIGLWSYYAERRNWNRE